MYKPNQLSDDYILKKVDASVFEDAVVAFWKNFLQSYRNYVDEKYSTWYEEFPQSFVFMKSTHWVAVFKNNYITFYIFDNPSDEISFGYQQFTTLGEMRTYDSLTEEEKHDKLQSITHRKDTPITTFEIKYGFEQPAIIHQGHASNNPDDLPEMGMLYGRQFAQKHGDQLIKEKKERFSLFELESYVLKVNDEHFEYEIGEAIAAYKHGLYLASTAVTGVALENILMKIIVRELGKNKLPNESVRTTKKLLGVLIEHGIIKERESRRFLKFNEIRNESSHSNDGTSLASDTEIGFSVIKDLIDQFYS